MSNSPLRDLLLCPGWECLLGGVGGFVSDDQRLHLPTDRIVLLLKNANVSGFAHGVTESPSEVRATDRSSGCLLTRKT